MDGLAAYSSCVEDIVIPMLISGTGVAIAAIAYRNRDKPEWQRDMKGIYILALGQVALGFVSWYLLSR